MTRPRWLNLTLLIFLFVGGSVVFCLYNDDWHWRMGLLSHFCMQHFIGLGCLALVALFFRAWKTLAAFLVLMAFCFTPMIPLFFDSSRHTFEEDFKAGLVNLNGDETNMDDLMQRAMQHQVDLLMFVGVKPEHLPQLQAESQVYPHQLHQARGDAFGVAILTKKAAQSSSITPFVPDGLPSLVATFEGKNKPIHVIVTNERAVDSAEATARRDQSLQALTQRVRQLPEGGDVIVAGNFNLSPFNQIFQRTVQQAGLFNSAHGFGYQPTWPSSLSISARPIDHVLLSKNLLVADRQVGPDIGADHYPIWLGLGFAQQQSEDTF